MRIKTAYILAISALLGACSRPANQDKPVISVSIEPQRTMLAELAGDDYEIVALLGNGANPETFDPSISQRVKANESVAYFTVGHLPFEQRLMRDLDGVEIIDTSEGITTLTGTHSHNGEACSEADPHVWTSLRNASIIATNMAEALVRINPDKADTYNQRLQIMLQRYDSLDRVIASALAAAGTHAFAIWHPSLSYYARDYGLHQLPVSDGSKEISPAGMAAVIEEAKTDSVTVFFFQREYDSRQAESLNQAIGSRMVTINPLAPDWEAEIMSITSSLTDAATDNQP